MQHTSSTALETDTTNESLEVTSACEDQLWELLTSLSPRILWLHFGSLPARFRYFLPRKSSEKLPVDPGWMGSTLILQKEATAPPPPVGDRVWCLRNTAIRGASAVKFSQFADYFEGHVWDSLCWDFGALWVEGNVYYYTARYEIWNLYEPTGEAWVDTRVLYWTQLICNIYMFFICLYIWEQDSHVACHLSI